MPRHIKFGLAVLLIGYVIAGGYYREIMSRLQSVVDSGSEEVNPFAKPPDPLYHPTDPPMPVKVFIPTPGQDPMLQTEDRTIFTSSQVSNRARQILGELAAVLPKDTHVEEVFIADDGTAFIDFSEAFSSNHPGGIRNEQATIYAIVNSLTYNLPEIRQVQLLIGGTERETLAGHCILSLPLTMDLSITNVSNAQP